MEAVLRENGELPEHLRRPDLDLALLPIWHMFIDLAEGRQVSQVGPQPLSWPDMAAYQLVRNIRFTSLEIRLIRACDRAYLTVSAEMLKGKPDDDKRSG